MKHFKNGMARAWPRPVSRVPRGNTPVAKRSGRVSAKRELRSSRRPRARRERDIFFYKLFLLFPKELTGKVVLLPVVTRSEGRSETSVMTCQIRLGLPSYPATNIVIGHTTAEYILAV